MNAKGDLSKSVVSANFDVNYIRTELEKLNPGIKRRILEKFALAALGSILWVGGFISALANVKTEESGLQTDNLQTQWLEEHQAKMETLGVTMQDIGRRFEAIGDEINDRVASQEYRRSRPKSVSRVGQG